MYILPDESQTGAEKSANWLLLVFLEFFKNNNAGAAKPLSVLNNCGFYGKSIFYK